MSPGIGFGDYGDDHVRIALIENENRTRQAVRGIKEMFRKDGQRMNVVAVTDAQGAVVAPELLAAAEAVHRQLRANLPADYAGRMREVFASGAEMAVAVVRAARSSASRSSA